MITQIKLENFGPLRSLAWDNLSSINLVIGKNSSGKTSLLKVLYASMRTLEDYRRGQDQRLAAEILADKLYWTFQPEKIGDLVSKGANGPLSVRMTFDGRVFAFNFGKDTTRQISSIENHVLPRSSNSIFLPAKEVLSFFNVILRSREVDQAFGFDDTYLDLVRALRQQPTAGRNYDKFAAARKELDDLLDGRIEFDKKSSQWLFKKGNQKFPIGVTAEGIKKISILDTLLSNRYLDPNSIIFIDEPESALHPQAISRLLDIIYSVSLTGVQFFISTHSYFVIKKLALVARQHGVSMPVMSLGEDGVSAENLKDGMPANSIIDESVKLYEEDLALSFK